MQSLLHARPRHGNANAVEVGDDQQETQKSQNPCAVLHRLGMTVGVVIR